MVLINEMRLYFLSIAQGGQQLISYFKEAF